MRHNQKKKRQSLLLNPFLSPLSPVGSNQYFGAVCRRRNSLEVDVDAGCIGLQHPRATTIARRGDEWDAGVTPNRHQIEAVG